MIFQLGKLYEFYDSKDDECFIVEVVKQFKDSRFVMVVKESINTELQEGYVIHLNKYNDIWLKEYTIKEYKPQIRPELLEVYINLALDTKDEKWFMELMEIKNKQKVLNI